MLSRFFYWRIRITYGLTVCNEAAELDRLLAFLLEHKSRRDEIIVLQDITVADDAVTAVLNRYRHHLIWQQSRLNGDFATFKNQLIDRASGDYLFQLDADEVPGPGLMKPLKKIVAKQRKYDCFAVPRVNYVTGITPEHITRWNWKVDDQQRINFPDYQLRIIQLGKGDIRWRHRVHEELTGFANCWYLPADDNDACLMHRKHIERQVRQNDYYKSL